MDFSFLRNWFDTTNTSVNDVNLKPNNVEQSSSPSTDSNEYSIDDVEEDDEFEIIEDCEFINPRDPNEIHSLPDQASESIVEIAGFNKEKLLEMSNFCAISYGDSDEKLGKKYFRALADDDSLSSGNEEDFAILENEKMYKTRAELTREGYEIIPFGNSFEEDAGHVFIKGKEITIAYHGTRFKHGLWGLNDVITDLNASFTTSEPVLKGVKQPI